MKVDLETVLAALHAKQKDSDKCIAAQAELIEFLLSENNERQLEIDFLMSMLQVVTPTSGIADANGRVPMTRKTAAQLYAESGRAKMIERRDAALAAYEAREHGKGLSSDQDSSQESPDTILDASDPSGADDAATKH